MAPNETTPSFRQGFFLRCANRAGFTVTADPPAPPSDTPSSRCKSRAQVNLHSGSLGVVWGGSQQAAIYWTASKAAQHSLLGKVG